MAIRALLLSWVLIPFGASAGPLLSATYSTIISGTPISLTSTSATGTLIGSAFTLDPGSWFATTFCVGQAAGCAPRSRPFVAPVTRLELTFGRNGALAGTLGQASVVPGGASPDGIHGHARVLAKIGKSPSFTVLVVPINSGSGLTSVTPTSPTPSNNLTVTIENDVWHLGVVTQTGLTLGGFPLSDQRATGSVFVTAGGNTIVNLVNLSRIRLRGLALETFTSPTSLRLIYAPEPALMALLTAGAFVLSWMGRARSR
ncbi:MAG TPA: hypothetical protein VFT98_19870 [Myxococcota bacterium]|nr:hypothetical protein [Myxococcota bacterium]